MKEQKTLTYTQEKDLGDWAVDGLIAGIGAGAVMLAYVLAFGMLTGIAPAEAIGRFDPAQGGAWLPGLLAHLAVSGIYGMLFAIGWSVVQRLRSPGRLAIMIAGAIYGLVLFLLASAVLLDALDSGLRQFPPAQLVIAHLLYGLLLGYFVRRRF